MSACSACKFKAVSFSDSPFCKLEVLAEILTTSALSRKAASSKEVRVRVLGSTKKLTRVFPRNAGTFLISRVPICLNASVVSRTKLISSAVSSRSPRRSLRVQRLVIAFHVDSVRFVVGFLQAHLNLFARGGRQILAHVIGTNRQLAMA